jgi:hypothetical protein
MNGCQIGTQCPTLHAKQDQMYPIGFSVAPQGTKKISALRPRTVRDDHGFVLRASTVTSLRASTVTPTKQPERTSG